MITCYHFHYYYYVEDDTSQLPDVSGISPSEGSTEGNERIILRGTNLGESKDDIVKVLLVDIDCTKTLEYYSSGQDNNLLYCAVLGWGCALAPPPSNMTVWKILS